MANDTVITVVGNTTGAPEGRFFDTGAFVANFTIASTPRSFNRRTGQWEDGETLFLRCNAWGVLGEHLVETLDEESQRLLVQGRLKQRSFETKDGERRTVIELDVDEIGPSLRYATAQITKAAKKTAPSTGETTIGATLDDQPWASPADKQLAGVGAGDGPDF